MKYILVLLALAGACLAEKEHMLKSNRISNDVVTSIGTTCDECTTLVKRFRLAVQDPVKLEELKVLLNVMCRETSYAEECTLFVSKLDVLIKKLEPWLKDERAVCKKMHMCENNKLDAFRRLGMLYIKRAVDKVDGMKDLVCDECQFAARELKSIVEDKDKQREIREFFSVNICTRMASYRGMCDMLFEQLLPEIFAELDVMLQDTKKACADIGFCAGTPRRMNTNPAVTQKKMQQFLAKSGTVMTSQGPVLESCFECYYEMDVTIFCANEDRKPIGAILTTGVCTDIMPANFTASCNDFFGMYLDTVLYMTFKQPIPTMVCGKYITCDQVSASRMERVPMKERLGMRNNVCNAFTSFMKPELLVRENQELFVEHFRDNCNYLPTALMPACDTFMSGFVPRMMVKLSNLIDVKGEICNLIGDCISGMM